MNAQDRLRELMTGEFERLQSRNSRYSLRAFAKKLQLAPSQTSDLISGKRRFTRVLAEKVLGLLDDLDDREVETLLSECSVETRGRKRPGKTDTPSRVEYTQLTLDQFRHVGDWRSFAVLSLSETDRFRADAVWIARVIGIQPRQARRILERLERMGLLQRDSRGELRHAGIPLASPNGVPSLAIRRAHRERLDLAKESLDRDPIDERDITGITMAIDPEKIPEAKERIRAFRRSLCEFLESGPKRRVFHLSVQMFPLSRSETAPS